MKKGEGLNTKEVHRKLRKMIKAVIFDQDGVVLDSERIHFKSERLVLKNNNLSLSKGDHKKMKGIRGGEIFAFALNKNNVGGNVQDLLEEKRKIWKNLAKNGLKIFPCFYELVENLKKHYRLAITTSSGIRSRNLVKKLFPKQKGIFEVEITADDVSKGKPNPEPYLITAKKLCLNPNECVVIEDSLNGIKSAKSAGMKVIAVTNTFTKKEIGKEKPNVIVSSLCKINLGLIEDL